MADKDHPLSSAPRLIAGLLDGPIDHAWLDDGRGILSCVAGSQHSASGVAACPYYLRDDVVNALPPRLRTPPPHVTEGSLSYRRGTYHKISKFCTPQDWSQVVSILASSHGVRPAAWSLYSVIDATDVQRGLDPRNALRFATANAGRRVPAQRLLIELLHQVDDPGNRAGGLGLTGSAALDSTKVVTGNDLDLLAYDSTDPSRLRQALSRMGAIFLADLKSEDQRLKTYDASRIMPAIAGEATRLLFRARRRDVAWINGQRIDISRARNRCTWLPELIYVRSPVARHQGEYTITAVDDTCPVTLHVRGSDEVTRVVVTARGYQEAFRPGDRILLDGHRHHGTDGVTFASLDDATGHTVMLTGWEQEA